MHMAFPRGQSVSPGTMKSRVLEKWIVLGGSSETRQSALTKQEASRAPGLGSRLEEEWAEWEDSQPQGSHSQVQRLPCSSCRKG